MIKLEGTSEAIRVAIIIEEDIEGIRSFIYEKVIELGGTPVIRNIREIEDAIRVIIIYAKDINRLRKEVLDGGFHQIFWSVELNKEDKLFIGFNSKKYIIGFTGRKERVESVFSEFLKMIMDRTGLRYRAANSRRNNI